MSDRETADRSAMPKIIDKTDFSHRDDYAEVEKLQEASQSKYGKEQIPLPADIDLKGADPSRQLSNFEKPHENPNALVFRDGQTAGASESVGTRGRPNPSWNSPQTSSFNIPRRDIESITATFDKISGIQSIATLQKPKNVFLHWLKEIAVVVIISLLLSLVVKTFFFRAFYIPSGSMENTLQIDDRIFVSLLTPRYFDLQRGDVVVFEDTNHWLPQVAANKKPDNWLQQGLVFLGLMPDDSQQHLIKRIIGMPGDKVTCCSTEGKVEVNGVSLTEPYLYPGSEEMDFKFETTVPEGHVWVMGDHRNASADSRFHMQDPGNGFVPIKSIIGKANAVAWPINRWNVIDSYPEVFKDVSEASP